MATTEHVGLLTYKETADNKSLLYPITKAEAVDGLEELLDELAPRQVLVTLSASAWTSGTQTVTVAGVSATETAQLILPVPAIVSQSAYMKAGILCTGQAANRLTFTATTVPTDDLTVYIVMMEVLSA